jgi:hemolysin III
MLYGSSTLYRAITIPDFKKVLQEIDHAAIFLLIAGTCTPFTTVNLRGCR